MFGEVSSAVEKALKKKADKTGMPYGVLKQVFNRGMAAWKTGHNLEQVNSNGVTLESIALLQKVKGHGEEQIKT